jgi:hypothetical protein
MKKIELYKIESMQGKTLFFRVNNPGYVVAPPPPPAYYEYAHLGSWTRGRGPPWTNRRFP